MPFPTDAETDLERPAPAEVHHGGGSRPRRRQESGLTTVQRGVLNALVESMTGVAVDVAKLEPLGPEEFAESLRRRNAAFRTRMVQATLLAEMLLVPIPPDVTERVEPTRRPSASATHGPRRAPRSPAGRSASR